MKEPGKKGSKGLDRRSFIRQAGVAAAGMTIVPSTVVSGLGHVMPSDKLNIAGVGVGGMGRSNLRNMNSQNIVALCDVHANATRVKDRFPELSTIQGLKETIETVSGP